MPPNAPTKAKPIERQATLRLCRDGDFDVTSPDDGADLVGIPKQAAHDPQVAVAVVRRLCEWIEGS